MHPWSPEPKRIGGDAGLARLGLDRQALNLGQRDIPGEPSQFALHASFSFGAAEHDLIARRRGDSLKPGWSLHIGFVRMERASAEQPAGCGGSCLVGRSRQRKRAPAIEIDHANRPSSADLEMNRNPRCDKHLRTRERDFHSGRQLTFRLALVFAEVSRSYRINLHRKYDNPGYGSSPTASASAASSASDRPCCTSPCACSEPSAAHALASTRVRPSSSSGSKFMPRDS